MQILLNLKDYLLKRLSEKSTQLSIVNGTIGVLVAAHAIPPEVGGSVATALSALIAGTPDKQHDS